MRKLIGTALFIVAAIFAGAATQSPVSADVATSYLDDDVSTESIPEPITGDPVMPNPGSETKQKVPSEPYDVGPPEQVWKYDQLSPAEQEAVERGRAAGAARAGKMDEALSRAAKEHSKRARAEAAEHQLGVYELGRMGVIP
jgi:hypothetical protein